MICSSCGHNWELQRAHIIRTERTPEGRRELVQCPHCGRVESITKPDVGERNGD